MKGGVTVIKKHYKYQNISFAGTNVHLHLLCGSWLITVRSKRTTFPFPHTGGGSHRNIYVNNTQSNNKNLILR